MLTVLGIPLHGCYEPTRTGGAAGDQTTGRPGLHAPPAARSAAAPTAPGAAKSVRETAAAAFRILVCCALFTHECA
eukprot:1162136-Pelagomonas_calceolata.AAC.15